MSVPSIFLLCGGNMRYFQRRPLTFSHASFFFWRCVVFVCIYCWRDIFDVCSILPLVAFLVTVCITLTEISPISAFVTMDRLIMIETINRIQWSESCPRDNAHFFTANLWNIHFIEFSIVPSCSMHSIQSRKFVCYFSS